MITITVWSLREPMDDGTREVFRDELDPVLESSGSARVALLETENAVNTFPVLAVREGEQVVVRVARFDDLDAYEAHRGRLAESAEWRVRSELLSGLTEPLPLVLRLAPASRSLLR